jgi:hypothetical protein
MQFHVNGKAGGCFPSHQWTYQACAASPASVAVAIINMAAHRGHCRLLTCWPLGLMVMISAVPIIYLSIPRVCRYTVVARPVSGDAARGRRGAAAQTRSAVATGHSP